MKYIYTSKYVVYIYIHTSLFAKKDIISWLLDTRRNDAMKKISTVYVFTYILPCLQRDYFYYYYYYYYYYYRMTTSGWQGAPYLRRNVWALVSKPATSLMKSWGATQERLVIRNPIYILD